MTYKLRSAPASPFARKVRIAASLLGLGDKIDVRATDLNDPPTASARKIHSAKFRC
jgi:glutathione S-transferase